jgi:hypothetical protein
MVQQDYASIETRFKHALTDIQSGRFDVPTSVVSPVMCVVRTTLPEYRVVTPFWMPHAVDTRKIQFGFSGAYATHREAQKRKPATTRKAWPYERPMANDSLTIIMPEKTPPTKKDNLATVHEWNHKTLIARKDGESRDAL